MIGWLHEWYQELSSPVKYVMDAISAGVAVVTLFLSWLPHVAALGSVIWVGLRIYETYLNIRIAKRTLKEN